MRIINVIAMALLVIGGLNWLLVGLFSFDLVAAIFGGGCPTPASSPQSGASSTLPFP